MRCLRWFVILATVSCAAGKAPPTAVQPRLVAAAPDAGRLHVARRLPDPSPDLSPDGAESGVAQSWFMAGWTWLGFRYRIPPGAAAVIWVSRYYKGRLDRSTCLHRVVVPARTPSVHRVRFFAIHDGTHAPPRRKFWMIDDGTSRSVSTWVPHPNLRGELRVSVLWVRRQPLERVRLGRTYPLVAHYGAPDKVTSMADPYEGATRHRVGTVLQIRFVRVDRVGRPGFDAGRCRPRPAQ